jgi:HK97 family phage major capsid protein
MGITAPSYGFVVHSSSTGAPAVVAEGGLKPDVVLNTTSSIATAVKLAAMFGISHESRSDWPQFLSDANTEMVRQIEDVETAQLLNGSGTGGNITGVLNTSGILTRAIATETALASFPKRPSFICATQSPQPAKPAAARQSAQ